MFTFYISHNNCMTCTVSELSHELTGMNTLITNNVLFLFRIFVVLLMLLLRICMTLAKCTS